MLGSIQKVISDTPGPSGADAVASVKIRNNRGPSAALTDNKSIRVVLQAVGPALFIPVVESTQMSIIGTYLDLLPLKFSVTPLNLADAARDILIPKRVG